MLSHLYGTKSERACSHDPIRFAALSLLMSDALVHNG